MPAFSARYGARLTVGLQCAEQEYQTVFHFLPDIPVPPLIIGDDILTHWSGTLRAFYRACLAADCYISGVEVSGTCKGQVDPRRNIYAPTAYPGTVAGESYSQNCSMLLSFYSAVQVAHTTRRRVAKNFIGPPPEANCAADHITPGFVTGALQTFASALVTTFAGSNGATWYRALNPDSNPAHTVDVCDVYRVRPNIVTQKRRVRPIF